VNIIAERILNEAKVATVSELEIVIGLIFKKALAEPHYCETYADLVYHLKSHMPAFPNPDEGGKPVTFKSTLLNVCQNEFEAMPRTLNSEEMEACKGDTEELDFLKSQMKARFLANMRFIGNLFLRQLLTAKIIASIMQDLTLCNTTNADLAPEEHVIECICELLTSIGYTLDAMPAGGGPLTQVCGRLMDLKQRTTKVGKIERGIYSKRIQFKIQEVLETRAAGWTRKTFKAVAKTKEEVRQEQERDIKAAVSGKDLKGAETVVAGQRPAYLNEAGSSPQAAGAGGDWQDAASKSRRR
jgi:hypothetical protein